MNNDYNNQQPQQPYQQPYQPPMKQPGDSQATGALVCGIISLVFAWFGYSSLIALAAGIVGIILSNNAKKAGFVGGKLTAGLVMSIIGAVISVIGFIACIACVACAATAGVAGGMS